MMIYADRDTAVADLHWLLRECSVPPLSSLKLSEYESAIVENELSQIDDDAIMLFYEDLFDRLGLKSVSWSDEILHQSLPVLALVPGEGIRVIMAHEANSYWKSESREGLRNERDFPEGTLFTAIKLERKRQGKRSAREMFKAIALKQKSAIVHAAIAALSINILALATSFFSMQVYDRVIPTQGIPTLIALGIGVSIAIFLEMLLKLSRSYILDGAAASMDIQYSHDIFDRFLKVRADALPKSVGTLSGQLQSYATVRAFISSAALYILIDFPFSMIFLAVIIMLAGWTIGMVVVVFMIAAIAAGLFFKKKIEHLSQTSTMASHQKLGLLVESVENAENVKATGAGWSLLSRWNALSEDAIYDDIKIKHYSDMSVFFAGSLQQFSYVAIVAVGAYLVSTTDKLTMGGLIATTILSGRVLSPIAQIPGLLVQWGRTKMSIGDLDNVYALDMDNEGVERPLMPVRLQPSFRCENLRFAYGESTPVVAIDKCAIREGEKVAILGTIGSGKSTLLKILAGLYKPSEGKIYLDNMDMHQISRNRLNEVIGYLPQHITLISGTLRDNLLLGLTGITDEQIMDAASKTGLITLISALPQGLDTPVPEGGESVSGGQKQMIAITRLVLMDPLALLMDEPTANMDDRTERQILQTIQTMMTPEKTLVVVTHKPTLLALVDRIIVVSPQGIVADGPKEAVLKKLSGTAKRGAKHEA
jgi:ATP-binding cassette subfamily C protein LapB